MINVDTIALVFLLCGDKLPSMGHIECEESFALHNGLAFEDTDEVVGNHLLDIDLVLGMHDVSDIAWGFNNVFTLIIVGVASGPGP